ncbi:hypothetical protein [Moraxella lacunata]|uniref:hypothetical protein n=1 Tax=Moraxella lacunata TaxID=477 RepID=UPI003EE122B4
MAVRLVGFFMAGTSKRTYFYFIKFFHHFSKILPKFSQNIPCIHGEFCYTVTRFID